MRKPLAYVLLLLAAAVLFGCGDAGENTNENSANTPWTPTPTPTSTARPTPTPANANGTKDGNTSGNNGNRNGNKSGNANANANANANVNARKSIDEILDGLHTANIAYNAPEMMYLDEPMVIQLELSPSQSTEELSKIIKEPGKIETESGIKITEEMEAQLSADPTVFKIIEIGSARQPIPQHEPTVWKWEVSPLRSGRQKLILVLSAIIDNNGKEQNRLIKTFDKEIYVQVTWRKRVTSFFSQNWQWLWAAILVPVGGALVVALRRRISSRNSEKLRPSESEAMALIRECLTSQYKKVDSSEISFEFGKINFGTPTQSHFPKDHPKQGATAYPVRVSVTVTVTRDSKSGNKVEKIERGKGKETFYFFKDDFNQWDLEILDS